MKIYYEIILIIYPNISAIISAMLLKNWKRNSIIKETLYRLPRTTLSKQLFHKSKNSQAC